MQNEMSDVQRKAYELYIESAVFENDFKPITEENLSARLKDIGFNVSSSTINR